MIGYASRTGTKRNLEALRAEGWRLLVSAAGKWRTEGFRYGIDNGAWTAYRTRRPFDAGRFEGCVAELGTGADWIVVPDIVCGGLESLAFSESWLPRLPATAQLLLPVQDGMTPADVRSMVGGRVGIFVGGEDAFKESTAHVWGNLARERDCYLHVGRVNSMRRIRICAMAGAHSFDGTSVSRYSTTIRRLNNARVQRAFILGGT